MRCEIDSRIDIKCTRWVYHNFTSEKKDKMINQNKLSIMELKRKWNETELRGDEVLDIEINDIYCFQCHNHVKVRLIERFPNEPLQPERIWCGMCGSLIGTSYHIPERGGCSG